MEHESRPEAECSSSGCVDDTLGDPYCFESDPVALKNNPDYNKLLQTLCVLEAQRARAIADMELLYEAQEKVLQDPISFVDRLQRTGNLGIPLPGRQEIAELPTIDWQKYTNSLDFKTLGSQRQSARLKNHGNEMAEDDHLQRLKNSLEGTANSGEGTAAEGFVRGRFKDESKSATFNKLWTPEEQQRLDELLIQFPPEEVEARRWRKIAAAFGDRTPQQIASRVQKYFQKLERNRLPVPGRVPSRTGPRVKKASHRHRQSWMYRDSTFLQRYQPPVRMTEDGHDDDLMTPIAPHAQPAPGLSEPSGEGLGKKGRSCTQDQSDDESIPVEMKQTAEYKELKQLKRLREEKLQTLDSSVPQHHGFKCDRCGCAPIVGVRWHCVDCPSSTSLDFCQTCYYSVGGGEMGCHNSSHRMRPVKRTWSKATQDQDYMNFSNTQTTTQPTAQPPTHTPTHYNYLDPNYMPAV